MSTLDWTLDTSSKYEVSSKEHMLQIMSNGTLYTDTGDSPTSYWSSDYIQIVDIDLGTDAGITPIGTTLEPFTGSYDGDYFSITDWGYSTLTDDNVGLFGVVEGSTIENINLEGTWTLTGVGSCGFLVGSASLSSSIHNVSGEFSSGSITCTGVYVGGLVGYGSSSVFEGLTMKGILSNIQGNNNTGGVIGYLTGSEARYVRNIVRFSSDPGISSTNYAGGVMGNSELSTIQYVFNSMVGNITGTSCGGVVCVCIGTPSNTIDHIVCSMTGNIVATGTGTLGVSGGVFGYLETSSGDCTVDSLVNYMSGGITGLFPGGLAGTAPDNGSNFSTITNSINAMYGFVEYVAVSEPGTLHVTEIQTVEDFGLTYTNIGHPTLGTTNTLTGLTGSFVTHSDFGDLSYFPFEGTDTVGNSYFFEFVFANISGSATFSTFTHFVISSDNVCGPIDVQVQLPDNSVEYLYKSNTTTEIVIASSSVTVIYSSGTVVDELGETLYPVLSISAVSTSPFSVNISWVAVDDASSYRIDYSSDSSITVTGTTKTSVFNLESSTLYEFTLYSSEDDVVFTLVPDGIVNITTPVNNASGYNISEFLVDDVYDFSEFAPGKASELASIITDIFDQDESVKMIVHGTVTELLVSGVSGETINVVDNDDYILPFQSGGVSNQTLVVEGLYNGTLTYDESLNQIEIDGIAYSSGDTVLIDGVRITIKSL